MTKRFRLCRNVSLSQRFRSGNIRFRVPMIFNFVLLEGLVKMLFRKKIVVSVIAAVALGVAGGAAAQEKKSEVSVYGNLTSQTKPSGNSDTTGTFFGSYGYYFTPQLVGNVLAMYSGSSGSNTTGGGAGLKYYFKVGKKGDFVPFVGGDIQGVSISNGGGSYTQEDVFVGASYFLSETASFDIKGQYEWHGSSGGSFNQKTENVTVNFGLTYRF